MNQRGIIALLCLMIIATAALGTACLAVSAYKTQSAAAAETAPPQRETRFAKQLREQREQSKSSHQPTEADWSKPDTTPVKPFKKDSQLKAKRYHLAVKPENLTTPDELAAELAKMTAELAEQRQKCDDRKALIDLRYEQQDITADQRSRDIAKIDFYKEQYTVSVMQNSLTLIDNSPCLTEEEKISQRAPFQQQLETAKTLSEQARAAYESK